MATTTTITEIITLHGITTGTITGTQIIITTDNRL